MDDPASRMPSDVVATSVARLTREELADLVGDSVERIRDLSARGVIQADEAGLYAPGDAHRIRVIDGFEAAGVPLDVLVRAQAAGVISVALEVNLTGVFRPTVKILVYVNGPPPACRI